MNSESETETEAQTRYDMIETGGGQCVIYDRDKSTAWLQSDHVVDVDL